MELYLIRHPRPNIDAGICYGQTDVDVKPEDMNAAIETLSTLIPSNCEVWSSPLMRCRQLAEALHASPKFDDRLKEIHFGDWENKTWDQIGKHAVGQWAADVINFIPPNGESVANLRERVKTFLEILPLNRSVVIVTHGGVIRAIAGLLINSNAGNWTQLSFGYASMSMIARQKNGFELKKVIS